MWNVQYVSADHFPGTCNWNVIHRSMLWQLCVKSNFIACHIYHVEYTGSHLYFYSHLHIKISLQLKKLGHRYNYNYIYHNYIYNYI